MQPNARPAQPPPARTSTWWWFLIPAFTLGSASFLMVFLGGWKLKSRAHMLAAGVYLLANAFCLLGIVLTPSSTTGETEPASGTAGSVVLAVYLIVAWLAGTLHTLYLALRVSRLPSAPPPLPTHSPDPAIAAAQWRVDRRAEARQLLQSNPAMAWELRIGRPDIKQRQYDDGGLVDINHVPASWLTYVLQIPPPLAEEIVEARTVHEGLTSPEELIVYCPGMTDDRLAMIRDYLIFRPV
ncbi:helix-hairpin-helix domain-containing protein [Actinoplanes sp. NPDC026619]|uniref:ComEA family DNA-binding protein n=1 Tax=Actinoplanes sp. NPDC026619 TaxID=3155798 RepID=UPI0033F1C9DF